MPHINASEVFAR